MKSNWIYLKEKSVISYLLLFIGLLVFYILTMPPNVTFEDTGIFAGACYSLGLAHPPGYPLYIYTCYPLANIITLLGGNPALGAALTSAVFASITCVLLAWFVNRQLNKKYLGHGIGAFLGLNPIVIAQAQIPEVYTLNLLLIMITLIIADNYLRTKDPKQLYFLALVTGLGLANHWPLYILTYPVILLWLIPIRNYLFKDLINIKVLSKFILCMILGLSPYLHLLIVADSAYKFNDIISNSDVFAYIRRDHYGLGDKIISNELLYKNFINLLIYISENLYYIFVPLFLYGLYKLIQVAKSQFMAVLVGCCATSLILYFIRPIYIEIDYVRLSYSAYLLPCFLFISISIANAFNSKWITKNKNELYFFVISFVVLFAANFNSSNRSNDDIAYVFAKNMYEIMDDNSALLYELSDNYTPMIYIKYINQNDKNITGMSNYDYLGKLQNNKLTDSTLTKIKNDKRRIYMYDYFKIDNIAVDYYGYFSAVNKVEDPGKVYLLFTDEDRQYFHKLIQMRKQGIKNEYSNLFVSEVFLLLTRQLLHVQKDPFQELSIADQLLLADLLSLPIGRFVKFIYNTVDNNKSVDFNTILVEFQELLPYLTQLPIYEHVNVLHVYANALVAAGNIELAKEVLHDALEVFDSTVNRNIIVDLLQLHALAEEFESYAKIRRRYIGVRDDEIFAEFDKLCATKLNINSCK